jgi:hypothetical protein
MRLKDVLWGLAAMVHRLIHRSRRVRRRLARARAVPRSVENPLLTATPVVKTTAVDAPDVTVLQAEAQFQDTVNTIAPDGSVVLDDLDETEESPPTLVPALSEPSEIPSAQEIAVSHDVFAQIKQVEVDEPLPVFTEGVFPSHEAGGGESEDTLSDQWSSEVLLETPDAADAPHVVENEEIPESPQAELPRLVLSEAIAPHHTPPRRPKPPLMPLFDFSQHPRISKQELRDFMRLTEVSGLSSLPNLAARRIDALLMEALKEVDLIGELPISEAAFRTIVAVMRCEFSADRRPDVKRVWPALFATSMVFCARYSEENARNFWTPYAQLVWELSEASQDFQNQCRRHFGSCRTWLAQEYGLDFPVIPERPGSVVRPVFYHAVIPFYLQDNFAHWLTENLDRLLEYDAGSLPVVLRTDPSLAHVATTLRRFLQDEETVHSAAQLIAHLNQAAKLFLEGEEDVAALMTNPIQRALWKEIELVLTEKVERENIRRARQPTLAWIWSLENAELMLRLTNISAEPGHQPDVCVWTDKSRVDLARSDVLERVSPWKRPDGRWLVDEALLTDGPSDGRVYVLSVEHDDDAPDVVYQADVPALPGDPVVFFRVSRGNWGIWVDHHRVTDGNWLVSMTSDVEIIDEDGQPCQWVESRYLPDMLREHVGHVHAGVVNLVLPVAIIHKGRELFRIERQPDSVGQPWVDGPNAVPDLSPHIPPIFTDWPVKLHIPFSEMNRLNRVTLTVRSSGQTYVAQSLEEMHERGILEITPHGGVVVLDRIVPNVGGVYVVDLRLGLQSLLDEPLQFSVLPGISLQSPDLNKLYLPTRLPSAFISGVHDEQVVVPHRTECLPDAQGIKITWRDLRRPECSLRLVISGHHIPLAWPIRRVWAWVDGPASDGTLRAKHRNESVVHVRGPRDQWLSWRITNDAQERQFRLGARGESDFALAQDQLIEMIEHCPHTHVGVNLSAGEDEWKLFEYVRKPDVKVRHIRYDADAKQLSLDCQMGHVRVGEFRLQLVDSEAPDEDPVFEQYFRQFENSLRFRCELKPREYRIRLFSKDEQLELEPSVALLTVGGQTPSIQIGPQTSHQFDILMLSGSAYQNMLSYRDDPLSLIIRQLAEINKPSTWIQTYGLLPAWIVTRHPLMLTTREHRVELSVYPEVAAHRGRAGKGYVDLKLEGNTQTRVYATWEPLAMAANALYSSQLRLMIPTSEVSGSFSSLDEYDLWPAYQCSQCGRIVGSRSGNYLKLSPSTLNMHQHGRKYQDKRERFRDIVYDYDVHVSVASLKRERLTYVFSPRQVTDSAYLLENLRKPTTRLISDATPGFITPDAHRRAITEWIGRYHTGYRKTLETLVEDVRWRRGFEQLEHSRSRIAGIPVVAATNRLLDTMRGRPSHDMLVSLDRNMILLALCLRTSASALQAHEELKRAAGFTGADLHQMVSLALESCPQLLQWAISWVELFRVHAIS